MSDERDTVADFYAALASWLADAELIALPKRHANPYESFSPFV